MRRSGHARENRKSSVATLAGCQVEVSWPGGATRELIDLTADRTWWIDPPGEGGDANGDGVVDFNDLLELLSKWGPCAGCLADLDADGTIDFADLLQVLSAWASGSA